MLEYEDRLSIATPEGVELDLTLAGLGSRAIAGGVDLLIKLAIIGLLALAGSAIGDGFGVAVVLIAAFLVLFFYDVLFELVGRGRTPGKRWSGLRVVRSSGRPVDARASVIRNLLRIIDGWPLSYVPTIVSILVTARNQRLGDLAADTVVIRERHAASSVAPAAKPWTPTLDDEAAGWDVSAITAEEMAAVNGFLVRRQSLSGAARHRLAQQLVAALHPRVGGAGRPGANEQFLERLAAAKASRERDPA